MRPLVFPVLHFLHDSQAMENAAIAVDAGVDGIFLISMDGQDERLEAPARAIKATWPSLKVGINYLQSSAQNAIARNIEAGLDMTWADDAGLHSVRPNALLSSAIVAELSREPTHQFFGGVAFKYMAPEPNPGHTAVAAQLLGILPTTSGAGTGIAADPEKLKVMHRALAGGPLAIASGITPDNVLEYSPYVTHILVASGIGLDFHNFDFELLSQLMGKLKTAERAKGRAS